MVYPSLKNPGLDLPFENFRLISNLQFVSKSDRACGGLSDSVSHNYKINNPETALLKVTNDLLMNMDKCSLRTVDHGKGVAAWIRGYSAGKREENSLLLATTNNY